MTGCTHLVLAAGGGLVSTAAFTAWNVIARQLSGNAGGRLQFNSDGTVTKIITSGSSFGTDGTPNWWRPATTGIGGRFWIKCACTAGALSYDDGQGTWLALTGTRQWGHTDSTLAGDATITLYIATAANDSAIIATYAGNRIQRVHS